MPMPSRNILLFVLFLASLLPACKEQPAMPAELQEINEMLEGKPGNPYYPLRDYKQKAQEQPEAIRMYYDFLTIKFENRHMVYDRRSKLYHHSDSLITNVLRYYEETDNRKLLPEIYYYAGRIYAKMGDAPRALDYYHQALNAASAQTPERLMQRIYFQMGHLFWFHSVYNEALKAQLKALSYKQLAADSVSEVFILKSLGVTYADIGKTDSAFFYYKEALQKAETLRNASLAFYVKENMAALYLSQGDYMPAWNLLESPPADIDESVRTVLYQLKAQLYHQTGKADSAMHYNRLIEDRGSVYNKQKASLDMANILAGQNRYKEAAGYFQQYVTYADSIQKLTRTEALTKAQATYNYQLRERENNQLKLKKRRAAHAYLGLSAGRVADNRSRNSLPAQPTPETERTFERTGTPTGRTVPPKQGIHRTQQCLDTRTGKATGFHLRRELTDEAAPANPARATPPTQHPGGSRNARTRIGCAIVPPVGHLHQVPSSRRLQRTIRSRLAGPATGYRPYVQLIHQPPLRPLHPRRARAAHLSLS